MCLSGWFITHRHQPNQRWSEEGARCESSEWHTRKFCFVQSHAIRMAYWWSFRSLLSQLPLRSPQTLWAGFTTITYSHNIQYYHAIISLLLFYVALPLVLAVQPVLLLQVFLSGQYHLFYLVFPSRQGDPAPTEQLNPSRTDCVVVK